MKREELIKILNRNFNDKFHDDVPQNDIDFVYNKVVDDIIASHPEQEAIGVPSDSDIEKEAERLGEREDGNRIKFIDGNYFEGFIDGTNYLKSHLKAGYKDEFIAWLSHGLVRGVINLDLPINYRYKDEVYSLPDLFKFWQETIEGK